MGWTQGRRSSASLLPAQDQSGSAHDIDSGAAGRRTQASALIATGAPVTEVQHRLGHASPAITLQVHSHFFKHTESNAADRLAEVVLGSNGTRGTEEPIAAIA